MKEDTYGIVKYNDKYKVQRTSDEKVPQLYFFLTELVKKRESVNRRTDNTMAKRGRNKRHTKRCTEN
jgi:hypothetical protein